VHSDSRAAESARAVGARAYTVGRNIAFGGGEYRPDAEGGRRLLAHELSHVVQQAGATQPAIQRAGVDEGEPEPAVAPGDTPAPQPMQTPNAAPSGHAAVNRQRKRERRAMHSRSERSSALSGQRSQTT
jgi:hypothetical protein